MDQTDDLRSRAGEPAEPAGETLPVPAVAGPPSVAGGAVLGERPGLATHPALGGRTRPHDTGVGGRTEWPVGPAAETSLTASDRDPSAAGGVSSTGTIATGAPTVAAEPALSAPASVQGRAALLPSWLSAWVGALLMRLVGPRGRRDAGMSTAEYAVGTIAACAFAAVLFKVVTSGTVLGLLQSVVTRALHAL